MTSPNFLRRHVAQARLLGPSRDGVNEPGQAQCQARDDREGVHSVISFDRKNARGCPFFGIAIAIVAKLKTIRRMPRTTARPSTRLADKRGQHDASAENDQHQVSDPIGDRDGFVLAQRPASSGPRIFVKDHAASDGEHADSDGNAKQQVHCGVRSAAQARNNKAGAHHDSNQNNHYVCLIDVQTFKSEMASAPLGGCP